MIIYDVVNIFSMKNYESSRKLRVGVNWYPGVNWSTTTNANSKALPCEIFLLPFFLSVSTSSSMHRKCYIMNRKYFILHNIQHIVESYRYFYIIFLNLSFNSNKMYVIIEIHGLEET